MAQRAILLIAACLLWCSACAGDETRWARTPMPPPPPEGKRTLERFDPDTGQLVRRWTIRYASNGRAFQDGPEWLYFSDGSPRVVRDWAEGEPCGLWEAFHPDGALRMRVRHTAEPSPMVFFHPSSTLSAQGLALGGVKQGAWAHFHADGSLSHAGRYERGMKQGPWTHYHPGGALARRGSYQDGHMQGTWRRWDPEPSTWNDAWWPKKLSEPQAVREDAN